MSRARIVIGYETGVKADYRTSQISWIEDAFDDVSMRVSQRISTMTNLDLMSAEMTQVNNYGIGGEYVPHVDSPEHMSDVQLGGNTVFPELGVSVAPRKGFAVFWFNLNHDGSIDYRMAHAGCPVVHGSKWVCNKWFHEAGQEWNSQPPCLRHKNSTRKYFYL